MTRGAIILSDESTARVEFEDWLHDYYEIDDEEAEYLTASVLTAEAREYAMSLFGLDSEWSAEHSAEAIYEPAGEGRAAPR